MITIDSKVDLFNKVVLEKIELEYKRQLEEVEIANEMILADYQKEAAKKAEQFVDKMVKDAEVERKRTLAKVKGEIKGRILNTRAHLLDDLVLAVEERAKKFVTTESYDACFLNWFASSIHDFDELDALVLVTVDKDIKRFKTRLWELAERLGYRGNLTFEATDAPIIGGAIIYNEEKTIKFDMTIRSIIDENYGMIAQKLHRMLKEEGEAHE